MRDPGPAFRRIPSIDELLKTPLAVEAIDRFGRQSLVEALRRSAEDVRGAAASIAFSSEVEAGSRQGNASK